MRKAPLLVSTAALALALAQIASADASYPDPAGDSTTAPDVTGVTAANDAAGNLTMTIKTNQPTLASDALVDIAFDIDHNPDTGRNGIEFLFLMGSDGWEFVKWDGANFAIANAPSAHGSYAGGVATFKVSKADLGGVSGFTFWANSFQLDANGNFIAEDTAPDGTDAYRYTFTKPLTLRPGAIASVPAKPAAGKALAVRLPVTRGDTGGPLTSGTVTCAARVGTAAVRAAGRVAGGVATCSLRVPKTAEGKRVRVTMKVTLQGVSTSKTFSSRVR